MNEILIACKIHGYKPKSEFYVTNGHYRCKECHKEQYRKKQYKSKLEPKTLDDYIVKTCIDHGELQKEDVYLDVNFNTFRCKKCVAEGVKVYRHKNKNKKNEAQKKYRKNMSDEQKEKAKIASKKWKEKKKLEDPEYFNRINRECSKRNPEQRRLQRITHRYGLRAEDYLRMYKEQNGKCAICKKDNPDGKSAWLVVDHNHLTNEVRELICSKCNKGLGHFEDNVAYLEYAQRYILKHTKTFN